jgi:hypothetical protein
MDLFSVQKFVEIFFAATNNLITFSLATLAVLVTGYRPMHRRDV